jgi:hypothetical protein
MWPILTRDGVVDPRFYLDGDHLNMRYAEEALTMLLNDLVRKRGAPRTLTREEIFIASQ